jgi:L-serine dehydratase
MRAAYRFARGFAPRNLLDRVHRVQVELYGSLALTGIGHATDRAVLLGLSSNEPASIDPESIESIVAAIRKTRCIHFAATRPIDFDEARDLLFHRGLMFPPGEQTQHPNGLRLTAYDASGVALDERTFFSIGGGFITEDGCDPSAEKPHTTIPFPFHNAAELLATAQANELSISQLMLENECALLNLDPHGTGRAPVHVVREGIEKIWQVMQACVLRGMATEGILPGGLSVRRRAHRLAARLREKEADGFHGDPLAALDWVTVYAMAVNEENAAGGRVVTAPTNGAAGVVPAVAHYYDRFIPEADHEGILRFFLTSAAIGILYKENASISGAEVGCRVRWA